MYRLCAGLAAVGSVARVALPPVFGCLTAPRRYMTPFWLAQDGAPVTRLDVLADCHPFCSVILCQVRVASLAVLPGRAGALCPRACAGAACTGAAAAAVPPSTVIRAAVGKISPAGRNDRNARDFTLVLPPTIGPRPRSPLTGIAAIPHPGSYSRPWRLPQGVKSG